MNIEDRIKELNLQLPPAPPLGGVYKPVIQVGNMLYVSGQGPVRNDTSLITGKLGKELTTREGYDAARQVGLTMLATMKAQEGQVSSLTAISTVRSAAKAAEVNAATASTDDSKIRFMFSVLFRISG